MLDLWLSGIEGLLQWRELRFLALGMVTGLFFGAIPGLGGATALALLMPLTYGLEPFSALALSGGVMGAVPMGGSITAILLNTPGTAPNAATCLDAYPLAQQGKAGVAIGAAASGRSRSARSAARECSPSCGSSFHSCSVSSYIRGCCSAVAEMNILTRRHYEIRAFRARLG